MDEALSLRIQRDTGELPDETEIRKRLETSPLVSALTADFIRKPLFAVWRLIALSEIPYAASLDYTKQVADFVLDHMATPSGFTLSGKDTDLLPCYNAMLLEAFSKLGYADTDAARNAVAWIRNYQPFERNIPTLWTGKGILKYGGCLKATPCYIGIGKTVKALCHYSRATMNADPAISALIDKGMAYLCRHNLFRRLSNGEPVTRHILDIAFPASYHLNIVELMEIAFFTGYVRMDCSQDALDYVKRMKIQDDYWKINFIYQADGYVSFDRKGQKGEWVTYLLERYTA